ncbi:MAG: type II toxin-antitoxin system RelE/ParE family toxin [Acetobacteraceae bacterium]
MPYEIVRSPTARRDIREFVRYLKREAGDATARAWLDALEHELQSVIANHPNVFSWFHETGEPYRAKLFKLARTTYWIINVVNDELRRVEIVRFWNSARQPLTHRLG